MDQTSNMQSQINSRMDQNRGKNDKEALERPEQRYRDHFRQKAHKKYDINRKKGTVQYTPHRDKRL